MSERWQVVKVGGSLYDRPALSARLRRFLQTLDTTRVLIVPGGGATADAIRQFDQVHHIGDVAAHWLALQTLSVNAGFVRTLLANARILASTADAENAPSGWYILDALPFFTEDDANADHLPHSWDVTSDSLAVRTATLLRAEELILLKSKDWQGDNWQDASRAGVVDVYFPEAVAQSGRAFRIRWVNLRSETP